MSVFRMSKFLNTISFLKYTQKYVVLFIKPVLMWQRSKNNFNTAEIMFVCVYLLFITAMPFCYHYNLVLFR